MTPECIVYKFYSVRDGPTRDGPKVNLISRISPVWIFIQEVRDNIPNQSSKDGIISTEQLDIRVPPYHFGRGRENIGGILLS